MRPLFHSCFTKLSLLSRKMISTRSSHSGAGRRQMRNCEPDPPRVLHPERKHIFIIDKMPMPTSNSTTTTAPHHPSTPIASLLPAEGSTLGDFDPKTTVINSTSTTELGPHGAYNPWSLNSSKLARSTQPRANRVSWPLFTGSDFNRVFPPPPIQSLLFPPPSTPSPAPPPSHEPSPSPAPRDMVQTSWFSAGAEGGESDQDEDETNLYSPTR